jgi:ketosteroid isomerase-like protein
VDHSELVRDGVERLGRGDLSFVTEHFAEDVRWFPAQPWMEDDVYEGHDGVRKLASLWFENFDEYEWVPETIEQDGDRVLALVRQRGKLKGTEAFVEQPLGSVFEMRGGRVAGARSYWTFEEARAAFSS